MRIFKYITICTLIFYAAFSYGLSRQELVWLNTFDCTSYGYGSDIATNSENNIFLTGHFRGEVTVDGGVLHSGPFHEAYVIKLDENGNAMWGRKVEGTGDSRGVAVTVDEGSNAYITGHFKRTASFGRHTLHTNSYHDAYVAKIDRYGNWLWATEIGGSMRSHGYAVALDSRENVYVTGYFSDTAYFGGHQLTSRGDLDTFVAKLDRNGNWLWARRAGGLNESRAYSIVVENDADVYITGQFIGNADFGDFNLQNSFGYDAFVAKLDTDGNWQWVTGTTGRQSGFGLALTVDSDSNLYVSGWFVGTITFGETQLIGNNSTNSFIAKIDSQGNWVWVKSVFSSRDNRSYSLTIDADDILWLTGYIENVTHFGDIKLSPQGPRDTYLARITGEGEWLWAERIGNVRYDHGYAIHRDSKSNILFSGVYGARSYSGNISYEDADIFIGKYMRINTDVETLYAPSTATRLINNYPNPFNPETTISYSIETENEEIDLSIFNIRGQLVRTLFKGIHPPGSFEIVWDGKGNNGEELTSGVYFYRLKAGSYRQAIKMLLLK